MANEAEKIINMTFRDYYVALKEVERIRVRAILMEGCGWPYPTFYSKVNGTGKFRLTECEKIESLLGIQFNWED